MQIMFIHGKLEVQDPIPIKDFKYKWDSTQPSVVMRITGFVAVEKGLCPNGDLKVLKKRMVRLGRKWLLPPFLGEELESIGATKG